MRALALARCFTFALVTTLSFGPAGPALAGEAQDAGLAAGIRQVDEGDFEAAVTTLGPVADRLSARGGHDAAQACLYLGIAHLALDQRDAARARFLEALGHEPSLRLGSDRFSPKVISAFEEARREREAAARAAGTAPAGQSGAQKSGHAGRTALIAGGAAAAGVGIALAVAGGGTTSSGGMVRFTAARFGTPALECPNGSLGVPLPAAIDLNAQNDTGRDATINSVSAVLTIVASPGAPGEIGFQGSQPATVVPATLRAGTSTVRVQTTLTCDNGPGDPPRFNDWKGRVTLTTGGEALVVETADTMRVNIP
jgi:hypothetical protein